MRWKEDLGDQIRRHRKASRQSQRDLARAAGITRQMISRYENGRDVPTVDVLARIAEFLDTGFVVKGYRVDFEKTPDRPRLRVEHKQLQLPFDKARRFTHAVVEITPYKGRLYIKAEIPA